MRLVHTLFCVAMVLVFLVNCLVIAVFASAMGLWNYERDSGAQAQLEIAIPAQVPTPGPAAGPQHTRQPTQLAPDTISRTCLSDLVNATARVDSSAMLGFATRRRVDSDYPIERSMRDRSGFVELRFDGHVTIVRPGGATEGRWPARRLFLAHTKKIQCATLVAVQ